MTSAAPRAMPAPRSLAQFLPFGMTFVLLSGSLLLAGCSTDTEAEARGAAVADTAIPVRVASLTNAGASGVTAIAVTGTLAGKEEVALAFKVGGVVSRITVDAGAAVRAGQVLAELRPTEIAAQVSSARQSRAKAERDFARVTRLYADSVATLEQVQDARTALDVATNAVRIAEFNADYAVIRAPGDGIVLTRAAEPGQVVEPGRTIVTVRRNARGMVVRMGLADHDAVRVTLGDTATVRFAALPGRQFTARVTERAATATPGTGSYAVEVTLPPSANALPTGLVAAVTLHPRGVALSARSARVLVPFDALVDADGDSAAVFVLRADGRSVTRRALRLADVADALQSAAVPVVAGLDGTETVVTAGMSRLIDGTRVRVMTTAAQRSASDAAPKWRVGQ